MASLKDKVQNALDESRMLVLGAQLLLGFQYRAGFESGFESLPASSRVLIGATLVLLILAIVLLILPATYHRVVEEGEETERFHRFILRIMAITLVPVALGLDVYIAAAKAAGARAGVLTGTAVFLTAAFFWYGLLFLKKRGKGGATVAQSKAGEDREPTGLRDKIKHVLTEARVVLPGVQALLGFQLATMLLESFDKLPPSSKQVHLASLILIALSTICLMAPAAYHRIVEEGEETEGFHRFASWMVLCGLAPLALGICGELFVVVRKISDSPALALAGSLVMLAFAYWLWFGFTPARRRDQRRAAG
jgi:uncharacterized membrane protein